MIMSILQRSALSDANSLKLPLYQITHTFIYFPPKEVLFLLIKVIVSHFSYVLFMFFKTSYLPPKHTYTHLSLLSLFSSSCSLLGPSTKINNKPSLSHLKTVSPPSFPPSTAPLAFRTSWDHCTYFLITDYPLLFNALQWGFHHNSFMKLLWQKSPVTSWLKQKHISSISFSWPYS